MKIVFYSSNSNIFDNSTFHINTYPSVNDIFSKFSKDYTTSDFYVVTQHPCFFLPEGGDKVLVLSQDATITDIANAIIAIKPDIAVAMSFWVDPYDWLTINDSLIAEILNENEIKTISQDIKTGMTCFDKTKTHEKLKALGFFVPNAVFVDHDMYFCAGSNKKVIHNVYKDYIASEIKNLTLPLIIKDTVGVSSYGTTVVHTYNEAIGYLNSKRNNSNRIVEEYITGSQFGCEIYGHDNNYSIMPPISFSLNQYGITSPKLSIKYGPIVEDINIEELNNLLLKLSEEMKFTGVTQVDLVYSNGKWYIIEINPRLSGMTYTYSSLLEKSIFEIVFDSCVKNEKIVINNHAKVLNIKLPVIPLVECEKVSKIDGVSFVHLTNDEKARQEREKGYCEIIIKRNSLSDIKTCLFNVMNALPKEDFSTVLQFIQHQK